MSSRQKILKQEKLILRPNLNRTESDASSTQWSVDLSPGPREFVLDALRQLKGVETKLKQVLDSLK